VNGGFVQEGEGMIGRSSSKGLLSTSTTPVRLAFSAVAFASELPDIAARPTPETTNTNDKHSL
jgi:hypothetical protein